MQPGRCRASCPALTPATIPQFMLPRRLKRTVLPELSSSSSDGLKMVRKTRRMSCDIKPSSKTTSAIIGQEESKLSVRARNKANILPRCSVDEGHSRLPYTTDSDTKREIWSESDPGFQLSMTFEHIPMMKTPYGFSYLVHSPVTLKRETPLNRPTSAQATKNRRNTMSKSAPSAITNKATLTTSTNSSLGENNCKVDISTSSSVNIKWDSSELSATCRIDERFINREQCPTSPFSYRSSSLRTSAMVVRSTLKSPKLSIDIDRLQAINQLHMMCARQLVSMSSRDLGDIELALQYDSRHRRLCVGVIRANGVGLSSRTSPCHMNTHVHLSLMPENRVQKQTKVVSGTCDPAFNEDFFFNISPCELLTSALRVRIYQSNRLLRTKTLATCIGEHHVSLLGLKDVSGKIVIREDLKTKRTKKDRGMVNISVCYRSRLKKLCVTIIRAANLPKSGLVKITPSCQVKVEISQVKNNALHTDVKQTGLRRWTTNPVFKESMSFDISDLNNLRDGMMVVCTLYTKSLTRKPRVLGQVMLGQGASRHTEKQQWADALKMPGSSINQWHAL